MESGIGGPGAGAPMYCGDCGRPLTADLTACPNCGRPIAAATPAQATPAITSDVTLPSGPTWQSTSAGPDSQIPTWQTPAVGGGVAPARGRGRRAVIMGGVAGLVLVALLATGVAYVLGAFASHTELDSAKYLPANTIAFSGIDVYSLAENSHNISLNTLVQGNGGGSLTKGTGLDWTNDVLPWLGRDVAAAVFPDSTGTTTASSPVSAVVLIQSHDDGKALAAMKKAADNGGTSATTSTYGGLTLYSQANGTTFSAGKGWALIATTTSAAKVVIDRLNGTGDTLASQQAFQNATNNLPGSRFGTAYVDLHAASSLLHLSSSGPAAQLLNTYPIGVGYTSWTNAGLHAQVTFNATNNAGTQYPAGNPLTLASAVPANAYAYASFGNLGGDLTAGAKQFGGDTATSITSALGVSLSDPALQQPAAISIFPTATGLFGGALLLNAPDANAATAFLQHLAAAHGCTLAASTGSDASAQALSCPASTLPPLGFGGVADAAGTGVSATPTTTSTILVEQAHGMMIFAPDDASLQVVTATLNGGASLAQASTFKSLVGQAPSGSQTITYLSISALTNVLGVVTTSLGAPSATATTTASPIQPTALLISSVSSAAQTQVSIDVALK